jgi:hypothetical protein
VHRKPFYVSSGPDSCNTTMTRIPPLLPSERTPTEAPDRQDLSFRAREMAAAAVSAIGALNETLLSWVSPPVFNLARRTVLGIFARLETGSLLIMDQASGAKYVFGESRLEENSEKAEAKSIYTVPSAKIVVTRDSFWLRLLLFADIGFAEAYMLGDFECNDLVSFFQVCKLLILYSAFEFNV